jgi:hypothetical protein
MSGAYPTSPKFNAVKFLSRWFNVVSNSITGRSQGRSLGGHRFEFSAKYPTLQRADFAAVDAFLMQQAGSKETFTIVLPVWSVASGSPTGTVLVNGAHSIGDTTISIDGLAGTLTLGDKVHFNSHTKVYTITADRTGSGSLSIQPPLIAALLNNEAVTYDNVPFTVRQKGDIQEMEATPGVLYSIEVDFIEAV